MMNEAQINAASERMKNLRDLEATWLGRTTAIINRCDEEGNRELTSSEKNSCDSAIAKVDAIQKEIVALKRDLEESNAVTADYAGSNAHTGRRTAPDQLPGDRYHGAAGGSPFAHSSDPHFARMFPAMANQKGGFQNLGEFAAAVLRGDPKLFNAVAGMSEGVGADGGFYVPGQFVGGVMDKSLAAEIIRPNAFIINATSNPITIPLFDSTNHTLGVAGMNPLAAPEGGVMTPTKPKLKDVVLNLKKQYIFVPATAELLEDAPSEFARMLERHMVLSMSAKLDDMFLWGTGAGEPLGIMNAPALVTASAEASQIADTITANNIAAMSARLAPGSWKSAKWLVSPSAVGQLYNLKTVVTNVAGTENVGGFGANIFNVGSDGQMTLLGREVLVTDSLKAIGDLGDIILADLSSYVVAVSASGMKLARSDHYYFNTDQVAFRLTMRVDGQPLQDAAITPRRGTATLSPFVTLAAR